MDGKPDPRQGGDVETPGTDDEVINDPLTHGEKDVLSSATAWRR